MVLTSIAPFIVHRPRLVAQYEYNNFPDTQRPGIYVVSAGSGSSQHFVESSLLNSVNYRFVAMLYDPFTRTVAAYCANYGIMAGDNENTCAKAASNVDSIETPTDMIAFLEGAASDYLLIVETHHWFDLPRVAPQPCAHRPFTSP